MVSENARFRLCASAVLHAMMAPQRAWSHSGASLCDNQRQPPKLHRRHCALSLLLVRRPHLVLTDFPPFTGFWLPVVSRAVTKALNVTDYNIVQNNGLRAAQVVPHVHFHIIPRPDTSRNTSGQSRSWTMFGRGVREDLDEEEAEGLAREMREVLRQEIRRMEERGSL